jgi:hypothetical protein
MQRRREDGGSPPGAGTTTLLTWIHGPPHLDHGRRADSEGRAVVIDHRAEALPEAGELDEFARSDGRQHVRAAHA